MKIVGVTVTYGDRHSMCLATVAAFLRNGVDDVVLISNGATKAAIEHIKDRTRDEPRVSVFHSDVNRGSAPGFSQGIAEALALDADWVWILDDDNLPEDGALHEAMMVARAHGVQRRVAVSSVRDSDESHTSILGGVLPGDAYPPPGSYFGVDLPRRLRTARRGSGTSTPGRVQGTDLPQAPYGGLLVARDDILRAGLPREDFVLYFDDVEFTRRLIATGTALVLAPNSRIKDQDVKWADNAEEPYISAMIRSRDKRKIYYSYRNAAWVDLAAARSHGARFRLLINFVTYSVYVLGKARFRHFWFTTLYLRAVMDGFSGRLGVKRGLTENAAS